MIEGGRCHPNDSDEEAIGPADSAAALPRARATLGRVSDPPAARPRGDGRRLRRGGPRRRRVALKVLPGWVAGEAERSSGSSARRRRRSRVQHPNVVAIHEAAQDGEVWFLVMELVSGGSLQDRLRRPARCRGAKRRGRWPTRAGAGGGPRRRASSTATSSRATSCWRRDGRSRSPTSGWRGWSSARVHAADGEGTTLGTPAYMSPEQCKLQKPDEFSDVYSLGATYYALLTGGPPYEGETAMQVMFAHCSLDPPDPCGRVAPGSRRAAGRRPARAMARVPPTGIRARRAARRPGDAARAAGHRPRVAAGAPAHPTPVAHGGGAGAAAAALHRGLGAWRVAPPTEAAPSFSFLDTLPPEGASWRRRCRRMTWRCRPRASSSSGSTGPAGPAGWPRSTCVPGS